LKTTIDCDGAITETVEFGEIREKVKLPSTNCTKNLRFVTIITTYAYISSSIHELNKNGGANDGECSLWLTTCNDQLEK
jgi:hypothetical protein